MDSHPYLYVNFSYAPIPDFGRGPCVMTRDYMIVRIPGCQAIPLENVVTNMAD